MLRGVVLAALAVLLAVPAPAHAHARLSIVTTIAQIAEPLRQVVGEHARVTSLMGEGIDPHLYRPTRSDMAALAQADLIFWNGLHLEAQMQGVLQRLATVRPVVALGDLLPESRIRGTALPDPHLWMDPGLWREALTHAVAALRELKPEAAAAFGANAERYFAGLAALERYVESIVATLPPQVRVLVTAHDAFGYFGERFGFDVLGIQGISTESEAGLRRIEFMVDLIVGRRIPAVFAETSVSERDVRALIEGAAASGHPVRLGGRLYSDAMGPPGTYEGTYIGMIDHNATTIVHALGGTVPARGHSGRLSRDVF